MNDQPKRHSDQPGSQPDSSEHLTRIPPVRSPVTGDLGGSGTAWVRLPAGTIGIPVPSLFVDERDLVSVDLATRGFERVGQRDPSVPIPVITTIGVDLWSRHDVDLIDTSDKSDPGSWYQLAGAAFSDPHPEEWWKFFHAEECMVTTIGDATPFIQNKWPEAIQPWVENLWLGHLPLTIRAWDDGIGTARSDQL